MSDPIEIWFTARAMSCSLAADSPIFRKPGLSAHVVDVKLEISASHDREDQTQAVFGLERIREVHDEPASGK